MWLLIIYLISIIVILFTNKYFVRFLYKIYSKPFTFERYSDFIPSEQIVDNQYIINTNNNYSVVLIIEGISYYEEEDLESAKLEAYNLKKMAFNLRNLQENIQVKFIFKKLKSNNEGYLSSSYIELTGPNLKDIQDVSSRLINTLNKFNARILKDTELIEFLYKHCNLFHRKVKSELFEWVNKRKSINAFCSAVETQFFESSGVLFKLGHKKHFKCFTLDFGSTINDKYFLDILTADLECDYIINSKFFNKLKAEEALSIDKKNITASSQPTAKHELSHSKFEASSKTISEIKEAQEILANEEASLIIMDAFIFIYADNETELEEKSLKIQDILSKYEILLSEESYLLNFFFLQRLIGFSMQDVMNLIIPHGDTLLFARKMLTITLAGLIDYIKIPTGLNKCDWGDKPIAKFNTHYNSLYNFYLHVNEGNSAVGHGVIMAPTGAGKTTFIQYIMQGILNNYSEVDVYSFDRFNGISIFTNWKQGKDISFNDLSMNPLQIDLNVIENKEFLNNLLIMISKAETTTDKEIISAFINLIAVVPIKERILKDLVNECFPKSLIRDNLKLWCDGKYAHYLNAPHDNFDLDNRFINFQMDKVLDDEELSAPIVSYIMFKIRQKARSTGRGHFVFIDETAQMIKNPFFRYQVQALLDDHRKLRGCVWLAFKNANAFLEDTLSQSILNQCQNKMLFTSDGINEKTLEKLQIYKNVYAEVKNSQRNYNNPYFVLLKRPHENIILNVDLKDKIDLKFLSSNAKDVNKMRELQKEYGNEWYKYF